MAENEGRGEKRKNRDNNEINRATKSFDITFPADIFYSLPVVMAQVVDQ